MRPRAGLALVFGALATAALAACSSDESPWSPAADSPIPRFEGPAIVVDEQLYVFGGFHDRKLHASTRVDSYDPVSDRWTRRADMPLPLTHLNPVLDGRTVWFAGGFEGQHPGPTVAHVLTYDVDADTWGTGPPLPAPRAGGALVRVGRSLHYFGGFAEDRDTTPGDHWALDLDAPVAWQPRARLPDPRGHVAGVVHEGRIFAVGGQHGHDVEAVDVASLHVYDPATDAWSERAGLPSARSHFEPGTFVDQGQIVIAGGRDNVGNRWALADVSAYDPASDTWRELPPLPHRLLGPVVQRIGPTLILTTGSLDNWKSPQSFTYRADAERYLR